MKQTHVKSAVDDSKDCAEHGSCSTREALRRMSAPLVRHVRNQVDVMRRNGISGSVWTRQKPLKPESLEWTSRVKKRHWLSSSENGRPRELTIPNLWTSRHRKEVCVSRDRAADYRIAHERDVDVVTTVTAC